ncbi:hypothetical protein D3C84_925440 [compost metagenome]
MQAPVQEAALDLAGSAHAEVDAHPRTFCPHRLERLGDTHPGLGHQVVHDPDVQITAQLLVHLVDLAAKPLDGHQHRLAGPQHLPPLVRQREAGPSALAQPHAQALLQVAHVQADGRAGNPQCALRSGKAAAFGHGLEQAQQAQIEIADLAQRGFLRHR